MKLKKRCHVRSEPAPPLVRVLVDTENVDVPYKWIYSERSKTCLMKSLYLFFRIFDPPSHIFWKWILLSLFMEGNILSHTISAGLLVLSKRCTLGSKSVTKSLVRGYQAKFAKTTPEHLQVCHIWPKFFFKNFFLYIFYLHNSIVSFQ